MNVDMIIAGFLILFISGLFGYIHILRNRKPKRFDFYLAGPMTGYKNHNFPAFDKAAKILRDKGYTVWSPAEHNGLGMTFAQCMSIDLEKIVNQCDNIVVLDKWRNSLGANCEVFTAFCMGKNVYRLRKSEVTNGAFDLQSIKYNMTGLLPSRLPYGDMARWKKLVGKKKVDEYRVNNLA
jgi:hypothetical protein